jgi:hypothetical protein
MATKNLVPRADNEGNIGLSTKKWAGAHFASGTFDGLKTLSLKTKNDQDLIVGGDNVDIVIAGQDDDNPGQITISSTASGGTGPISLNNLSDVIISDTPSPSSGQILVYSNPDENGLINLKNVAMSGHATISHSGVLTISETLFDGTQLKDSNDAPISPDNDDRFLMYDNSASEGSKLKYVKKSELLSGISSGSSTFVGLSDTSSSWANNNLVKANVDSNNNITFEPDTSTYLTSITASDLPAGTLTTSSLPSTAGILKIDANKNITSFQDNSTNWNNAHSWGNHSSAGYVKADGSVNFTLSQDIQLNSTTGNSHTIINVPNPANNNDVANKAYVDSVASGLQPFQEVKAATTQNLAVAATNTTLTASLNGAFTVDLNVSPAFVGTDNIIWSSFSSAGSFGAGDGISLDGSNFKLDINNNLSDIGTVVKDDVLAIKDASDSNDVTKSTTVGNLLSNMVDDSTIETNTDNNGDGKLRVKDNGITTSKLATISRNRLLGYLSTDTSTPVSNVSPIIVAPSTEDNAEWVSSDDVTISTQLSVKKYVDASINNLDLTNVSDDNSSMIQEFTLTEASNIATITAASDYSDLVNKVIKINLEGIWNPGSIRKKIIIQLPPLAQNDNTNEFIPGVLSAINSYSFFEIHIDSSAITNKFRYSDRSVSKPYIAFKAASSNCGFSNISHPFGFGLDNKSRFSSTIAKNNSKINFLSLNTSPSSTSSGSTNTIYGSNVTSMPIQAISLLCNSNNEIIEESNIDIIKVGLFRGSFIDRGQIRGWKYYIESYKL